jgi:DNA-binding SARP family transcriptional activator
VRFRILGPVEVWTGQDWGGIGSPKWRALVAALLLGRGQPVSTDQLIAELWGDDPPDRAANLVSVYVLRLRRVLGDDQGQVLITRAPGYQLQIDPGDLDAERFQVLATQGRRALVAGHSSRAAEVLAEALGLWRGRALADVPPSALVTAGARRLEEARLAALELRIEADMGCGLHAQLVPELRRLLSDQPLREEFWGQLIRALDGAGRHAEALAAYGQAREVISEELGVDPGPDLQRLYQAMLAADRSPQRRLAGSPGSSAIQSPSPQASDRGDGSLLTVNYDVFISHALADTAMARRLAEHLSSLDLQVFLDADRITSGDDWQRIISHALGNSSAIAVILSAGTNLSGYASSEISYASANARAGRSLLIPVYLDEQSAHNLPRELEKFHGVQAFDFPQLESAAQKIANAVRDVKESPDEPPDTPQESAKALAAHAMRMLDEIDELDDDAARGDLLQIAVQVARRLAEGGLHEDAVALLEQTLASSERILGPDHPSSLSVRANLAGVYQELGRHQEAVALLEQTLASSERILGPDHPSSLSVRANLAGVYQELGRHQEAVALLEQTLASSERILGPDHPSTRTVRANLAYVRRQPEGSDA